MSDVAEYFPFESGATWTYDAIEPLPYPGALIFERTLRVTGSKTIGGRSATVFVETASDGHVPPFESYLAKDSQGITNLGNDDSTDGVTSQLVPYPEVVFTAAIGEPVLQFDRRGVNLGEDYDFDGRAETAEVRSEIELEGIQSVSVPAGLFSDALVVRRTIRFELTFTTDGSNAVLIEEERRWFARGVGLVRVAYALRTEDGVLQGEGGDELIGYSIAGGGAGVLEQSLLARDLPVDRWTRLASAANADGAVVVYCSGGIGDPTAGYFAVHVDPVGIAGTPVRLSIGFCGAKPAIASDGSGYLVAFQSSHPDTDLSQIAGVRLTATGEPLDPVGGFAITASPYPGAAGPALAFDGGGYVVVYEEGSPIPLYPAPTMHAVRVSAAGAPGTPVGIDTGAVFPRSRSIAFDGEHFFVVGVHDPQPSGSGWTEIHGFFLDADLAIVGAPIAVATGLGERGEPEVSADGESHLVVWGGDAGAFFRRVSREGALLEGSAMPIPFASSEVELAFDGDEWIVVGAPKSIRLGRISREGTGPGASGAEVARNPNPSYGLVGVTLAAHGPRLLVAWLEEHPFGVADLRAVVLYSD